MNGLSRLCGTIHNRESMLCLVQDDILHPTLTVEEQLLFSARYRLPASCTGEERQCHVTRTLIALGLEGVREQLVGDETMRGISGGQVGGLAVLTYCLLSYSGMG